MTKIAMRFVTTTDIPIGDALVAIRLTRSDYEEKTSGVIMTRLEEFHTDADGFLQVDLLPAKALYHVTVYDTVQDIAIHHDFIVPEVEDQNTVLMLPDLIVPPDTVLSSFPYDEEALAKIIQAKAEAVAAALQSQASAATAMSAAATAVGAIDNVKANADKVEAWAATVDQQHTEVGGWAIQVAQNKTAVDAAVIVVNQGKNEAINAATGAKTSETNTANSAAAAHTDSLSATASKTAAAASATAADASKNAALNYANAAANNSNVAYEYAQSAFADAGRAATSATAAQAAMVNKLDKATAVVAPAANAVPRADANGKINPAWLDPNISLISSVPAGFGSANKFGFNYLQQGQGQRLYKLATLEPTASSTYSSLRIDAMLGGWDGAGLTAMTVVMGSRATPPEGVFVDWSVSRYVPANVRFQAYLEANGQVSVYLFLAAGSFSQASFNLMGMQTVTYESPVAVATASGALVWDSAVAPGAIGYKAPRSYGMAYATPTLPQGTSFDSIVEVRAQDGVAAATSYIVSAAKSDATATGVDNEVLRHGIAGNAGVNFSGFMQWLISAGNGGTFKTGYKLSLKARDTGSGTSTNTLFSVTGTGLVYAQWLKAGSASTRAIHTLNTTVAQFGEILEVGREGSATSCMAIRASDGLGGWNNAQSVMYVGRNSTTNRGVASPGTFNAQGTDYAEYFVKSLSCGVVTAGQVVGVDNKNQVTDLWAEAVTFVIKSTDPSFVGGDSWGSHLGARPSPLAGVKPTAPVRMYDVMGADPEGDEDGLIVTTPGDTDEEWEAKMTDYTMTVAEWEQAVEDDHLAQVDFDAKLEEARARVDRIAIAGRVPVNVQGAQPGDYIVPVQDGEGIKGIAVKEDDMTLRLYLRAVGQVITIEEDGRAYVMVKSV